MSYSLILQRGKQVVKQFSAMTSPWGRVLLPLPPILAPPEPHLPSRGAITPQSGRGDGPVAACGSGLAAALALASAALSPTARGRCAAADAGRSGRGSSLRPSPPGRGARAHCVPAAGTAGRGDASLRRAGAGRRGGWEHVATGESPPDTGPRSLPRPVSASRPGPSGLRDPSPCTPRDASSRAVRGTLSPRDPPRPAGTLAALRCPALQTPL